MIEVQLVDLLYYAGRYIVVFLIMLLVWFSAIIYNNYRWKHSVTDYMTAEQIQTSEYQKTKIEQLEEELRDYRKEVKELEAKLAVVRTYTLKNMEVLGG